MDFSSVGDFLRKAASSKERDREIIDEQLAPFLEDGSTVGITPDLHQTIESFVEKHGDEAYKQIGMFAIGQWGKVHQEQLQQHVMNEGVAEALLTMNDLSKINLCLQTLEAIGSFGGDASWRSMLKTVVGQAVLETLEERGIDPSEWMQEQ